MKFSQGPCQSANRRFPLLCRCSPGVVMILAMLLAATASAQQKIEFKDHPFFKRLIGEWSSEGERKYADGNLVKVTETWKTELSGENAITMEGTRDRAGQVTHYKWTFTVPD